MPTCCYEIFVDSATSYERIYRSDQPYDNNLILSPHLKKGTNKASILDFTILPGHPAYNSFQKMSTYVRLDRDGQTIFYGRVSDVKTDVYKQRGISCEGSLTFLKDSILAPNTFMDITTEEASGKKAKSKRYPNGEPRMSVEAFFRSLITTHNEQMSGTSDTNTRKQFTVGTVNINKRNVVDTFEVTSYSDISSVISSQLLGKYGGIIQTRYDWSSAINYIDWIEDYTTTNNQAIEFGINLLEIDSEKASDELWTMLLPIGADGVTIASVNNNSLYIPANPASDSMVQKYGKIIHYRKFEDASKASDLFNKANEYFNLHRKDYPDVFTVKAVDFHYLTPNTKQALDIGTKISVVSAPHGINIVRNCIEIDLDIQALENSTYTIGDVISPDERGDSGKSTLSSKHSSSSRRVGTAYNELSDRIDGLQGDVNINADNIAITAQNMALSLQNLAVDLIGDENHTGRITATANELRVEYNEKLYGEGGTAENPTGGIVTEYQSAISVTARQLTSDYTEKMYGTGGTASNPTGGLMADYRGLVTQTARDLTSDYTEKMYGSGGTADNPTGGLMADYRGTITQTARNLTSDYTEKMYGSGGTADNPTGGLMADYRGTITQTARNLTSDYTEKMYGSGGTASNPTGGIVGEYRSSFTQTAQELNSRVTYTDFNGNEIASRINQTATTILIQAKHINLDGYVTASQLSTTNANITNLTNGSTTAKHLKGTSISADNLYVYRSAGAGSEYKKFIPSFLSLSTSLTKSFILATGDINIAHSHTGSFSGHEITMGGAVATDSSSRVINIQHSHQVTVSNDGTVTLGSMTSTGGSFRIADTKTYKDGVSAATAAGVASVTVSSIARRSGESDTYNSSSSSHTTTVHLVATASNGATKNQDITVYGTGAYNDGRSSVSVSSVSYRNKSYDYDNQEYTVNVRGSASNGDYKDAAITVDASLAYTSGYNDGYNDGYMQGSSGGETPIGGDDNDVTVSDIRFSSSARISNTQVRAGIYITLTNGNTTYHTLDIDATSVYNKGFSDGQPDGATAAMNACTVTYVNVIKPQGYATVNIKYNNTTWTKNCSNYNVTG